MIKKIYSKLFKPTWEIKIKKITEEIELVTVTRPISLFIDQVALLSELLFNIFSMYDTAVCSQHYILPKQKNYEDFTNELERFANSKNFQYKITNSFTSREAPIVDTGGETDLVIHSWGKPSREWMERFVLYFGERVSHCIYFYKKVPNDWLEETIRLNEKVQIFFDFIGNPDELLRFEFVNLNFLEFASEGWLFFIVQEKFHKECILKEVEKLACKEYLTIMINQENND